MSIEGRKEALTEKHEILEERIHDLVVNHPSASTEEISELKKQKLLIKEELYAIEKEAVAA